MSFSNSDVIAVWIKGAVIVGYDPATWRRDVYGLAIKFADYGNRDSEYGWEIDHIVPQSRSGSDHPSNLRPLHWQNNAKRQAGTLV